jgi:hypothetical protein
MYSVKTRQILYARSVYRHKSHQEDPKNVREINAADNAKLAAKVRKVLKVKTKEMNICQEHASKQCICAELKVSVPERAGLCVRIGSGRTIKTGSYIPSSE